MNNDDVIECWGMDDDTYFYVIKSRFEKICVEAGYSSKILAQLDETDRENRGQQGIYQDKTNQWRGGFLRLDHQRPQRADAVGGYSRQ